MPEWARRALAAALAKSREVTGTRVRTNPGFRRRVASVKPRIPALHAPPPAQGRDGVGLVALACDMIKRQAALA